jgi:hypothetical protein
MLFARIALLVAVCSCHHLPCCADITPSSPPTKTQDKADSPPHPSDADVDGTDNDNADDNAADKNTDTDADVDADKDPVTQTTNDAAADDDAAQR